MGWRRSITCVLLTAGIVIASAGCAAPPPAATAGIGTGWFDDAVRILSQSRGMARPTILAGTGTPRANSVVRSLDDVVTRAPEVRFRTPEMTRQLDELLAAQQVARQLDAAVFLADTQGSSQAATARTAAESATTYRQVSDELSSAGRDILKDTTCDIVGNALLPGEKEDVEDTVRRGEAVDDRADVIDGLGESFDKAVGEYGQRQVGRLFGRPGLAVVEWTQWQSSVREAATNAVADRDDRIPVPGGGAVTRAYVEYMRICLRPPR